MGFKHSSAEAHATMQNAKHIPQIAGTKIWMREKLWDKNLDAGKIVGQKFGCGTNCGTKIWMQENCETKCGTKIWMREKFWDKNLDAGKIVGQFVGQFVGQKLGCRKILGLKYVIRKHCM